MKKMLCPHSIINFNIRKGALLIIIVVHEFWLWKSHNRYKYRWGARALILYSRYRYLKVIASALLLIQFQNGLKSQGNFLLLHSRSTTQERNVWINCRSLFSHLLKSSFGFGLQVLTGKSTKCFLEFCLTGNST